jgi:dihydropteroate synthase
MESGAEIINDISGLRWEPELASIAAETGAGLVLMHSRGNFLTMHSQPPVEDILDAVVDGLRTSVTVARNKDVRDDQIVLDIGLGFGKAPEQNLELLAKLGNIVDRLGTYPILVGASRKSFIGKVLSGVPPSERLGGSIAVAVLAVQNGAKILRVHDIKETAAALRVADAVKVKGT